MSWYPWYSFLELLNQHLDDLNNINKAAFVFLDSNIYLHKIQRDHTALTSLNNVIEYGFLKVITKSTRIHGQSHSLTLTYCLLTTYLLIKTLVRVTVVLLLRILVITLSTFNNLLLTHIKATINASLVENLTL